MCEMEESTIAAHTERVPYQLCIIKDIFGTNNQLLLIEQIFSIAHNSILSSSSEQHPTYHRCSDY